MNNNQKATKRALLTSVMALVMCVVMLVGTTFAWFTDTASTGVNKIQAGNLDITVEYAKEKMNADGTLAGELTEWAPIDDATNVFDPNALWEPGRTEYVVFRITNNGNLALKYKLSLETLAQKPGTNKANEQFYLADYLCASAKVDVGPGEIGSGVSALGAFMTKLNDLGVAGVQNVLDPEYHPLTDATVNGTLLPGKTNCVPMAIWMPTSVGNEANAISPDKAATIDFGITVVATQDTVENDSFGNTYDANATYPTVVSQNELNTTLTLDALKDENGKVSPVEVTLGDTTAEDIDYKQNNSGYTGKGVMLGSTNLNKYAATPAAAGEYKFTFKDGTINSAATGYGSIDNYKNTSVYMLVPGNSDVVFENMTFKGVVSFDIQKYTSPWSNLNSITFKNCTFDGIIIGTCPASNVTFDGCTFNAYTNTESANNSNPIWWREDTEGSGANANPIKTFTFVNNTVTGTRPVKIERIGKTVSPVFTIKNNTFNISAQDGDGTVKKNMAINIGMGENPNLPFTLIDDGNTISLNTAAMYTASLTGGSNWYKEMPGMKVLDGNGNAKTIKAMVWKTTTGETFDLKSVD